MTEPLTISRLIRKLGSHQKVKGDVPVVLMAGEKFVTPVLRTDTRGVITIADSGEEDFVEPKPGTDPAYQLADALSDLKSEEARVKSMQVEIDKLKLQNNQLSGDLRTLHEASTSGKSRRTQDSAKIRTLEEENKRLRRDMKVAEASLDAERAARSGSETAPSPPAKPGEAVGDEGAPRKG